MKKNLLLVAAAVLVVVGMSFDIMSDNGKAGYTGSPVNSSKKCNDCHGGTNGAVTATLTSNMTNWQYTPGQVYTMNFTVRHAGRSLFGYGLEVLNGSTNALVTGLSTISGNTKSTIKNFTKNAVNYPNMVHTLNGGATPDSATFSFKWTAPATVPASVKFWYTGLSANGDGSENSVDYIVSGSQVATLASTTAIGENNATDKNFTVITNAANRSLQLSFDADQASDASIMIFDMNAREVSRYNAGRVMAGENVVKMNLPGTIQNGIYVVVVRAGEQLLSRKTSILL